MADADNQAALPASPQMSNIPPPDKFSGANSPQQSELWHKWFRRFERYRFASGLQHKSDMEQVSTLLYSMGECADDILQTINIDETKATYDEVQIALNDYYQVRRNVLVERAKFNKRVQRPGESLDAFLQDLFKLADDCEYGTLKKELIRDRIIVGVLDDALSDRLQAKTKLTLEEAVQLSRQTEARKQSKEVIRGNTQPSNGYDAVNFVKRTTQHSKPSRNNEAKVESRKKPQPSSRCIWCGSQQRHDRKQCPARDKTCSNCGKRGHFQSVCRQEISKQTHSKPKVHEIVEDVSHMPFLGEVLGEIKGEDKSWVVQVGINNHVTRCKLDTGAAVTVLSDSLPWIKQQQLEPVTQSLMGPGGVHLTVLGSFLATMKYRQSKIQERVYVIKNQHCSLLSRQACVNLGLIRRLDVEVDELNTDTPNFRAEFPQLFTGLGKIQTECHITLQDDTKPFCLYTPRKIPHPLIPKVKLEIENMLELGVISPVTCPTRWCSGMVPVPKSNGRVRICVDLTQLNRAVQREVHPMPSVDESLAKLGQGKVFSKLDANSGFWQIPLDEESKLLTTFITPFGRFCFNRLPFGISSAPEIFQRIMSNTLEGLTGVICQLDDVLIHGTDQTEHDQRVRAALSRLQKAGLTLNEKCEFSKSSIKFLGHIIDDTGVHIDPDKTSAIAKFPKPSNVTELQRFMGMVNHLGKFVPNLATINEPLRQLLHKNNTWRWGEGQESAFQRIKELLLSPTVLAHYDPLRPTIIAADASTTGIGAVLIQIQPNGDRRPICFASRSLNETERRYAVIEKEALAVTWACEKFSQYITGLRFIAETDHKPLITLLNSKELAKMPARIQRFRLRLMRYNPQVVYVPGKFQLTADALSRAPVDHSDLRDDQLSSEVESFAVHTVRFLPATPKGLQEISQAQKRDEECALIRKFCTEGWPAYMPNNPLLRPYWEARGNLSLVDDLLLYGERLVIPRGKRLETLDKLHTGHLGITKCRARACQSVWWPGIHSSIEEMVSRCRTCAKHRPEQKEPLLPSSFPSRPWERIGTDLFELNGTIYIVVADYYSRWLEIKKVLKETSENIVLILKEIFSIHGIPDLVISDNGPQYASSTFQAFAQNYGFSHVTSSPKYPQANGESERFVRTAKELLKKNEDPYLSLLTYRSTPLQNGLSPAEMLMGRRLRTNLPVLPSSLKPRLQDMEAVRRKEDSYRSNQKRNFDLRHNAKNLPELQEGDKVWVRDQNREADVLCKSPHPRSYIVKTVKGVLRRNRSALVSLSPEIQPPTQAKSPADVYTSTESPLCVKTPKKTSSTVDTPSGTSQPVEPTATSTLPSVVTTRAGRVIRQPRRLDL